MTRIFGFESKTGVALEKEMLNREIAKVFANMQASLTRMYEYGWHSFGAGFIFADHTTAYPLSLYKGYRGLTPDRQNIWNELPNDMKDLLIKGNVKALFGVLESEADRGEEDFNKLNYADPDEIFPSQAKDWLVMTMGSYYHGDFSDQSLSWYNAEKPWLSVTQYLDTNPIQVNFDWIDKRRVPFIVCVNKAGSPIVVEDHFSKNNKKERTYYISENDTIRSYEGVHDREGNIV